MKQVTDLPLIEALTSAVMKRAERIMVSNNLYHFYFTNTSFSYTKSDIIKLLHKDSHETILSETKS